MKNSFLCFFLALGTLAYSQSLSIDSSFNEVTTAFTYGSAKVVKLQNDGKIIICGYFRNDGQGIAVVRLNTDGSYDSTFDIGTGFLSSEGSAGAVNDIEILSDGKILAVGQFDIFNGTARKNIVRLNTDGSLDTTFSDLTFFPGDSEHGFYYNTLRNVEVSSDGHIYIGGSFMLTSNYINCVAKLNSDGTVDTTFTGLGETAQSTIYDMKIQPDNKLLVTGDFVHNPLDIYRINTDGTFDETFTNNMTFECFYNQSIALQSDGKILISGLFRAPDRNSEWIYNLERLNSDGSTDVSFQAVRSHNEPIARISALSMYGDKIFIVNHQYSYLIRDYTNEFVLLNSDGTINPQFSAPGFVFPINIDRTINSIIVQPDNKIIVGGGFTGYNNVSFNGIARFEEFVLGVDSFSVRNSVVLYTNNGFSRYKSFHTLIKDIEAYDFNGKLIFKATDINARDFSTDKILGKTSISKVTLQDKSVKHIKSFN